MRRSILLFILVNSLFFACGDGLEHREDIDDQGYKVSYKVDPETGLKQGMASEYDPEGRLTTEENYVDGKLEGERRLYDPQGNLVVLENYLADRFEGEYLNYDTLGNIVLRGNYIDGAMNQNWYQYYPSGGVMEVVTFVDNKENGPFREWYEDGTPKASGTYRDGDNEDGLLHLYTETGELERVMQCSLKLCQTFWTPDSSGVAPAEVDMSRPE